MALGEEFRSEHSEKLKDIKVLHFSYFDFLTLKNEKHPYRYIIDLFKILTRDKTVAAAFDRKLCQCR